MEFSLDEIMAKVNAGIELSKEEEIFYLVKIMRAAKDRDDAIRIIAIADNNDPNLIID
ncbi:hypothetical protein QTN47_27315 [Danxiaibacter flavus]|uniref:Uncharacterized protein n=1 Tax=Danxiaibacter flavus TaxID=3049108 RepID=A0ABV3ZQL8_9BACT|nr:hypothetical protein QNM32_27315 [Chitinophagaceae bacterium DXS]